MENVTNQAVMETFVERAIATETAVPTDALAVLAAMGITPEAIAAMMAETKALKAKVEAFEAEKAEREKAEREKRRKSIQAQIAAFESASVKIEFTDKGCVKVIGLGPGCYGGCVTLYPWAWKKIAQKIGAVMGFLDAHPDKVVTLEQYVDRMGLDAVVKEFDPTLTAEEKAAAIVGKAKGK